ncbi:MAG TPA: hypothetical protein VGQ71_13715 [Terriglobales bacterium]|nr:hypothetical protein [Terriglobales bacterium]
MKSAALRVVESHVESSLAGRVLSPFTVREPRAPDTLPTGVPAVDALTGGLPRSALTEIFGPASSGRTSLLLSILAEVTLRKEVCALVDASDAFDPGSAAAAGADLKRLLWVRCGTRETRNEKRETFKRVEQALKATDLLLQAGGFGLVVVDLADIPPAVARRVPLASWFRFRRAVENTSTALLVIEQQPYAQTCASLVLRMQRNTSGLSFHPAKNGVPTHARLLRGISVSAEVVRSRLERKPVRAASANFETRAAWAG